jgi:hypothetical protein
MTWHRDAIPYINHSADSLSRFANGFIEKVTSMDPDSLSGALIANETIQVFDLLSCFRSSDAGIPFSTTWGGGSLDPEILPYIIKLYDADPTHDLVAYELRVLTDPVFPGRLPQVFEPWIELDRLFVTFQWPANSDILGKGDWAADLNPAAVASVLNALRPVLTYLRTHIGITFGPILSEVCMQTMLVSPALNNTRVWFFDYLSAIPCSSSEEDDASEADQIWLFTIMLLPITINIMELASDPVAALGLTIEDIALVAALAQFKILPPGREGVAMHSPLSQPLVIDPAIEDSW